MQKAYIPQIDGCHLKDLLAFIDKYPGTKEYLPDDEELPKSGKEWVANILYTLFPTEFQACILNAEKTRREKVNE